MSSDHLYPIDPRGELAETWRCPVCPGGGDGYTIILTQLKRSATGQYCPVKPVHVCARCWRNGIRTVANL